MVGDECYTLCLFIFGGGNDMNILANCHWQTTKICPMYDAELLIFAYIYF